MAMFLNQKLPRVELCKTGLRRFHANMLRLFAKHEHFESKHLRYTVGIRDGQKLVEFNSLSVLFEWANKNHINSTDVMEFSYRYDKYLSKTDDNRLIVMKTKVVFGEHSQNECIVNSNDCKWAEEIYEAVNQYARRASVWRTGALIQRTCFAIAALVLILLTVSIFPIESMETVLMVLILGLSGYLATITYDNWLIRDFFKNRIKFA